MYTVVVGIDQDTDRARAQAETVADLPCADEAVEAVLFHSFTDNPAGASVTQVESVREAADVLEEAGVAVELNEASGDPAEEIVDLADELDADMVCVAGRKRSPAGKAVFGSVAQDVILGTHRPVLVCEA